MSKPANSGAKWVTLIFLAFCGVFLWYAAEWFLPVYRWTQVDFEALALEKKVPLEELQKQERFSFRYNPRGQDDPLPWQIMMGTTSNPPSWEKDPDSGELIDEYNMLVRADLISDRTGRGPSVFMKGSAYYDNFFRGMAWRMPAGVLGRTHSRPVVLIDASTWEKFPIGDAKPIAQKLKIDLKKTNWVEDDSWDYGFPWREDPYIRPQDREPEPEPEEEAAEGTGGAEEDAAAE